VCLALGFGHQGGGEALAAVFGRYVEGDDVADALGLYALDVEDAEAGELAGFCGDDYESVAGFGEAAHRGAREAEGRTKAEDIEVVERVEVGGAVAAQG